MASLNNPLDGFPSWLGSKESHLQVQETQVGPLDWEDPLEEEMAPRSSIFAREIPWTEEPGSLQSMGSQVRHNLATKPPPSYNLS